MNYNSVYRESSLLAFYKSISVPSLRPVLIRCVTSIFYNFFFCQHRAAFLPGRVPVTGVDHPVLDKKIPFVPSWVTIYLDFVHFWIRMLSFLLRRYGRKSYKPVREFVDSMGRLYKYAAVVYMKNLTTTKRPFYIARPRFFVIHLLDPHLMCIPSLHVMVVIHTYTMFAAIARELGEEEKLKEHILELRQGALAISQAVLFVKQHSVNCIPAALYAMTCYTPALFPPEEAAAFTEQLFSPAPAAESTPAGADIARKRRMHPSAAPAVKIPPEDQAQIKSHILNQYRQYLAEKKSDELWDEPILKFLRGLN